MNLEAQRWDPSLPPFTQAVLRTLLGLLVLTSLLSALVFRTGFWGVLTGGLLALALYVLAMQTGSRILHHPRFGRVLIGLLVQQFGLWVCMGILLAVVKVHPIGFVLGAGILPVAILVTLTWYHVRQYRSSQ